MARVKKKPLRGSVRQNFVEDEAEPSRFGFGFRLAGLILGAILIIFVISWMWTGDWPRRKAAGALNLGVRATQKVGFAVSDVTVEGRRYTDKSMLFEALGVAAGSSTFTFDPAKARDAIMKLPWTKDVTVLRSMPDKIIVRLTEREPLARWQHNDKTSVIDAEGNEIFAARVEDFANLPLVVGNAAPAQTQALLTMLKDYPAVSKVLKAAVRVGERRWNFYIQPNLLIRLPEHGVDVAMDKLTKWIEEQKILDRNVVAIDLRFPDRTVIEPGIQPSAPSYGETSE